MKPIGCFVFWGVRTGSGLARRSDGVTRSGLAALELAGWSRTTWRRCARGRRRGPGRSAQHLSGDRSRDDEVVLGAFPPTAVPPSPSPLAGFSQAPLCCCVPDGPPGPPGEGDRLQRGLRGAGCLPVLVTPPLRCAEQCGARGGRLLFFLRWPIGLECRLESGGQTLLGLGMGRRGVAWPVRLRGRCVGVFGTAPLPCLPLACLSDR